MERVVQFKIPNSIISYNLKLTYNNSRILENVERQEIRRNDRTVEFRMLSDNEKEIFVRHFQNKINSLPVVHNK